MGQFAIGIGFIVAGIALNLLFPPELPDQEGFRLDDLRVTGSAYGKPINLAYGTVRLNGNIVWALPLIEVVNTDTVGENFLGKGGSTITEYTYFGTFAVALAEGPADAILKIWANNKLIWDATAPIGSDTSVDNGKYPITFYQGTKTQLPDPDIEADVGVDNTPAFRDTAYFVAKNWPLKDFGNSVPNITVQMTFNASSVNPVDFFDITGVNRVVPGAQLSESTGEYIMVHPFTGEVITYTIDGIGFLSRDTDASILEVNMEEGFAQAGTQTPQQAGHIPLHDDIMYLWWGNPTDLVGPDGAPTRIKTNTKTGKTLFKWNDGNDLTDTRGPVGHLRIGNTELGVAEKDYYVSINQTGGTNPSRDPVRIYRDDTDLVGVNDMIKVEASFFGTNADDTITGDVVMMDWFTGRVYAIFRTATSYRMYEIRGQLVTDENGNVSGLPTVHQIGSDITKATMFPTGGGKVQGFCWLPNENAIILSDDVDMVKMDMDAFTVLATRTGLGFEAPNQWTKSTKFAFVDDNYVFMETDAHYTLINTDDLTTIELIDKVAPLDEDHLFKNAAYDSRTNSLIISQGIGTSPPVNDELLAEVFLQRDSGGGILLSDIVTDISNKAGIVTADLDVTDLTDTTVDGYVISRESTYRQMIEPLQRVYFFEGVESDWGVKFVDRGKAVAGSIAEADIGALKPNDPKLIETRINDIELPGEILMSYVDKDRDHEKNTAASRRISKPAKTQFSDSDLEFEVAIVMDATTAEQTVEKSLYTQWAERIQLASELPWKYLKYEPTDNLTMQFNNESRRVRLSKFNIGADLSIQFEATQEDSDSHISTLIGFGGDGFIIQTLPSLSTTLFLPLDSPLQLDADASLLQFSRSYYAFGNLSSSAVLYRSLDSGQSYDPVDGNNVEATWGYLTGSVPLPGTTFTWDETNTITVTPIDGASRLVSSTDLAVLNGANAIAVEHSSGGVEIIQYVNVTDNGDGTYTLSRLLRGRRGTEDIAFVTNTHPSPRFIYLNAGVRTFTTALNHIDVTLPYRAVPSGAFLTDVQVDNVAYTGQDLIPYSVSQIDSSISGGDKIVTWVRRTRYSGELSPFTGEVPLNEDAELYDVEYFTPGTTTPVVLTRTDLTSPTDTLTNAEYQTNFNGGLPSNQISFSDWDFEETTGGGSGSGPNPAGWTQSPAGVNFDIMTSHSNLGGPPAGGGSQFLSHGTTLANGLDVVATSPLVDLVNAGFTPEFLDTLQTVAYDVWMGQPVDASDELIFDLRFLDSGQSLISSIGTGVQTITLGTWSNFTGNTPLPIGTRYLEVKFSINNIAGTKPWGAIDQIEVTLGADEVRDVEAKIYQKSSIMGRGRSTQVRI